MAMVSSVCIISYGCSGGNIRSFFEEFHALHYPNMLVPKNMSMLTVCPKCPEMDVRLIGYNYLDADAFHAAFDSHPWHLAPTLVIIESESDYVKVKPGDETLMITTVPKD